LARRLARRDERSVEIGEDMRKRAERLRDRVAREDFAAQCRQHLANAFALRLLDQRVEGLLDRESRLEERGEPARELRELRGGKRDGAETRPARGIVGGDDLDAIRGESLVAKLRARLARAVRFEDALVELPFDVIGLVAESRH
jgi:hypothetical protein